MTLERLKNSREEHQRTEMGCGGLRGLLLGVREDSWMYSKKTQTILIVEEDNKRAGGKEWEDVGCGM